MLHLARGALGFFFLPKVEATDLNKSLSIMDATLRLRKVGERCHMRPGWPLCARSRGGAVGRDTYIIDREPKSWTFLSRTLDPASAHSRRRGRGEGRGGQWPESKCSPEEAENKTTVNSASK